MTMRTAFTVVVTCVHAQSAPGQSAVPKPVPDEPSCERCTIEVTKLATLGTDDGPGALASRPMSVNVDGKGRYWVFVELEPPLVYGADGAFIRTLGRKGGGPGEFQSANNALAVGDSMLVFDWLSSRASMVGPDLSVARSAVIQSPLAPGFVITWPDAVIMSGEANQGAPTNRPMNRVTFADSSLKVLDTFGPENQHGPMVQFETSQLLAPSRGPRIWSSYVVRYLLSHWTADGKLLASYERKPDWFTGDPPHGLGTPTRPPSALVAGIGEDPAGLLWVLVSRPAPTWQEGWPKMTAGQREVSMRSLNYDKFYRTTIEVIDPAAVRVVARRDLDAYAMAMLPGGRAVIYGLDANDIPRLTIVGLALKGRTTR